MSKFFTASQIAKSIEILRDVHPFHGITFLACKQAKLPIGNQIEFVLDSATDSFLKKHHKIEPTSDWFFQPFKSSDKNKKWVNPKYASTGLQAVNTGSFREAFIHPRASRFWGWEKNYVALLESRLPKKKKIPVFHLAVWVYKQREWPDNVTPDKVIQAFKEEFNITQEEKTALFDDTLPNSSVVSTYFNDKIYLWTELRQLLPSAPDSKPDQGGILSYLELIGLGPAEKIVLEPADRLTLITGDNGLGKTFLLECCWWALTGTWAGRPALSNTSNYCDKTEITFAIKGRSSNPERKTISFDWKTLVWPTPKNRPTIPGLIVYARVDGSFAVWDPAKQGINQAEQRVVFSNTEVWDGLPGRIEGLIRDWVRWQNTPTLSPFETFKKVLAHMSPPDLGVFEPGEPIRVIGDPRDIPTIKHPFGITPIINSSAGVRRIITLAYLIVWAWTEHKIAANLARTAPQRRMVVLVDEMEAHLHPRWQRIVLPALMSLQAKLSIELEAQYIVATHSPLVMASSEEVFDPTIDSLIHLDLENGKVKLNEVDFIKFGDVSSWLTSPVFELKHARSSEAEAIIESAKALQNSTEVSSDEVCAVSEKLKQHLASDDKFWPRWIYFAEKHGVIL